MKPSTLRVVIMLVASVLLVNAASALAQNAHRDKRWEFTLLLTGLEGKDFAFDGGSTANTKDTLGLGFGMAYNVNPHLTLGGEFYWASMDYNATVRPAAGNPSSSYTARGEVDVGTFMLNATWNILAGPVTPYLQGGFGSAYVDTNIPTGPPINSCWYYPYWGYYCGTYAPTASYNTFSYNAGAGVRWDFSRTSFMRFGVQRQWMDFDGAVSSYDGMNVWRLEFGFKQ